MRYHYHHSAADVQVPGCGQPAAQRPGPVGHLSTAPGAAKPACRRGGSGIG
jgi:hypothetical protein